MAISLGTVISVLTTLGIGGLIGAYFQSLFEHQKRVREREHDMKYARYGAIIILMLTKLDPEANLAELQRRRPELGGIDQLDNELRMELHNSFLFAGDKVIGSIAQFLSNPNEASFVRAAVSMRKDLWGRKTSINAGVLGTCTLPGKQRRSD